MNGDEEGMGHLLEHVQADAVAEVTTTVRYQDLEREISTLFIVLVITTYQELTHDSITTSSINYTEIRLLLLRPCNGL